MWPIPFPASSLGLDIISSRKPSLTILDQIKWLFNTFFLQLPFITLFVFWLMKFKFSVVISVIFHTMWRESSPQHMFVEGLLNEGTSVY